MLPCSTRQVSRSTSTPWSTARPCSPMRARSSCSLRTAARTRSLPLIPKTIATTRTTKTARTTPPLRSTTSARHSVAPCRWVRCATGASAPWRAAVRRSVVVPSAHRLRPRRVAGPASQPSGRPAIPERPPQLPAVAPLPSARVLTTEPVRRRTA